MNNDRKLMKLVEHKKIFFCISLGIFLIGIICNIVFGTTLSINFTGGSIVKYSYTGTVDQQKMKDVLQDATDDTVSFTVSENLMADGSGGAAVAQGYVVSVQFSGNKTITPEVQDKMTTALSESFPDNNFAYSESNSVEASMGSKFFLKCIVAVAIACILMVLYVALRFKKISGLSAGVMALVALFHDVIMIYFTFVILRMPIDDNFIAVVLMILGYSLNDTIVIYDRVRENRTIMGRKTDETLLFDTSVTQVIRRTICTSLTTLAAIGCVFAVGIIFNIQSIITFALPMMIGVISGCYSSICIAGPLWVMWQNHKKEKKAAAKSARKAAKATK